MEGSDLLWRMGLQGDISEVAQGNYDYLSIGQAFAFLWRQSEYIPLLVRGFPISLDVEHVVVWGIGITSAFLLMVRTKNKNKQVLLALLFLPGAILSVALNQSSSEHPDYYSIFWHPALVIGLTYSILSILTRVPRKPLDLRIGVGVFSAWILFLWQVRYFFVAYPVSTNWPNN